MVRAVAFSPDSQAIASASGDKTVHFVDQIAVFGDELEKAFPVDVRCHKLAEIEIGGVGDEGSLKMLKMPTTTGRISAKVVTTKSHARASLGETFRHPSASLQQVKARECFTSAPLACSSAALS